MIDDLGMRVAPPKENREEDPAQPLVTKDCEDFEKRTENSLDERGDMLEKKYCLHRPCWGKIYGPLWMLTFLYLAICTIGTIFLGVLMASPYANQAIRAYTEGAGCQAPISDRQRFNWEFSNHQATQRLPYDGGGPPCEVDPETLEPYAWCEGGLDNTMSYEARFTITTSLTFVYSMLLVQPILYFMMAVFVIIKDVAYRAYAKGKMPSYKGGRRNRE